MYRAVFWMKGSGILIILMHSKVEGGIYTVTVKRSYFYLSAKNDISVFSNASYYDLYE